ncbi:MAG: ATP-grasp domain-containing protein [Candidatus Heimdallarchaeota archaeon]
MSSEQVSSSLFSEAFAMLRVLACTFASSGDRVLTLIDERIAPVMEALPSQAIVVNSEDGFYENLKKCATDADLIVCVAPETNGYLSLCNSLIEKVAPGKLVGCAEEFISLTGDKWQTALCWNSLKLSTPRTYRVRFDEAQDLLQKKTSSYVAKPFDGVSGDGIVLLSTPEDLINAQQQLPYLVEGFFLLQEFVKGIHGSLSYVCGDSPFLISANRQMINIHEDDGSFEYLGGETPWQHLQIPLISDRGKKFLEQLSGARGWVGIDFIADSTNYWFLECNPRVTSSVVGTWTLDSQAISANLKAALNFEDHKLPPPGYSVYKKAVCMGAESWEETLMLMEKPGIVSPPFPFQDLACSFLTAKGSSRKEAQQKMQSLENDLKKLKPIDGNK